MSNKQELYKEFENELGEDGHTSPDVNKLINYLFDFFNYNQLKELLEHIKEERNG